MDGVLTWPPSLALSAAVQATAEILVTANRAANSPQISFFMSFSFGELIPFERYNQAESSITALERKRAFA